jgi:hypothetical protein
MKCEELLKALNEFVDGTIEVGVCQEFQSHLAGCNPCKIVVDNVRQTIKLFKAGRPFDLPPVFQERLHGKLRERWSARFPSA